MAEAGVSAVSEQPEVDLREGFEAFVEAAQRLEESYSELKQRAAGVDLELAETNERLSRALREREMVFDALPVGVLALDRDGLVVSSNPEGERLAERIRSAGIDPRDVEPGPLQMEDCKLRVRRAKLPEDGNLLVLEDRTHVEQLEAKVHRLDRLAGLSELALGVAHEIKNPLNGVVGYASLMQRFEDPKVLRRFADKVVSGLGQVDDIVRSMLDFARPGKGRMRLRPLQDVVRDACAAGGIPLRSVRLVADTPERSIEADATARVLSNLFRNSAEASDGDSLQIEIRAEEGDGELRLVVRDNGPGVPAELADRLFEPFVSSKDRGHGLGLALSCRVLTFLGGSIELCNPGAPGATFRVVIPCGEVTA